MEKMYCIRNYRLSHTITNDVMPILRVHSLIEWLDMG